jgi:hypothetical protein
MSDVVNTTIFSIKLINPIRILDENKQVLDFREPNYADLLATDHLGDIETLGVLIERCADIPKSSVEKLTARDLAKISKELEGFLGDGEGETTEKEG